MITDPITKAEATKLLREQMDVVITNIRDVMIQKGISQKELSLRIDKSKEYVNYLLKHPCPNPKQELLVRIANKIGVTLSDLHKKQKPI